MRESWAHTFSCVKYLVTLSTSLIIKKKKKKKKKSVPVQDLEKDEKVLKTWEWVSNKDGILTTVESRLA